MPIYPGKVRYADISEGSAPKIPGEKNELVSYITACRDMRGNRVYREAIGVFNEAYLVDLIEN